MVKKDLRSSFVIKIDALKRLILWHYFSKKIPLYLVNEYPKSGGSWVACMISEYLDVEFIRNRQSKFKKSLLHGHHLYSSNFNNVFYVMRDGRDIMVSMYYHCLFNNEKNSPNLVKYFRKKLDFNDYNDIVTNLPTFIDFVFSDRYKGNKRFSWSEYVRSIDYSENNSIIFYEKLLQDPLPELSKAIINITNERIDKDKLSGIINKYSFANQKKIYTGKNDHSFLRKGVSGDWKNYFNLESCNLFNDLAGKELIFLGYEKDKSWIQDLK
tara:strand:+ start:1406 stop:2212 length:807 start_codon:yes stop_codon:yes gene_type:complete